MKWDSSILTPLGRLPARLVGVGDDVLALDLQPPHYGIDDPRFPPHLHPTMYLPHVLASSHVIKHEVSYRSDVTVIKLWQTKFVSTPDQQVLVHGQGWTPLGSLTLNNLVLYWHTTKEKLGLFRVLDIQHVYCDRDDPVAMARYERIVGIRRPLEIHSLSVSYPHSFLVGDRTNQGGIVVHDTLSQKKDEV